mgnify:CR=1 FL=1
MGTSGGESKSFLLLIPPYRNFLGCFEHCGNFLGLFGCLSTFEEEGDEKSVTIRRRFFIFSRIRRVNSTVLGSFFGSKGIRFSGKIFFILSV